MHHQLLHSRNAETDQETHPGFVAESRAGLGIKWLDAGHCQRTIGLCIKLLFEIHYEWRLGIDTKLHSLPATKSKFNDPSPNHPLSYYCLWQIRRYMRKHIDLNGEFVDFGCGTGRALAFLGPLFRWHYGIEIEKLPTNNLSIIRMDAVDWQSNGRESVLFFFNPFGVETLRQVLKHRGNARIIYVSPTKAHLDILGNGQIKHWHPDTFISS